MISRWRLPLALLSGSQAITQTISVFIMTLSSVTASTLSPDPGLTTLPVAAIIFGTMAGLIPFAGWMSKHGRRSGFRLGIVLGIAGAALTIAGLALRSIWIFTLGHFLMGFQQGAFQYLRFAASEIVPAEKRSQGISLILAGGVVAAFLGPWLAHFSRTQGLDLALGLAYAPVIILYGLMLLIFVFIPTLNSTPTQATETAAPRLPRKLGTIFTQPAYLKSLVGSLVGYSIMILLMTATPLAMGHQGHSSADTSWIIQWHVLGMFVPSFFTGTLIKMWGHRPILALGLLALFLDALVAIFYQGLGSYWLSLTLLGIGWNFLYIASTSSLTDTYRPEEKEKAQAAHDLVVFSFNTLSTYVAALLLKNIGWVNLHVWMLPVLALTALFILSPTRAAEPPVEVTP